MGPGILSQSTTTCPRCNGEGQCIPEGKRCKKCKGQKISKEKEILEVQLDKGVPNKHKYTFRGKSDE